jgi:hypothetical protein
MIVVAILLIAFPKLVTGDFVEATVVSIGNNGGNVIIEMDARISSGTGWGTTLSSGPFGGLSTYSRSAGHRARLLPTWPKHKTIFVTLTVRNNQMLERNAFEELLTVRQGTSYRVTPDRPLEIAPGNCRFSVRPGNRFGL